MKPLVVGVVCAAMLICLAMIGGYYGAYYYDPNQDKPDYCHVYGDELYWHGITLPYLINYNVAKRICSCEWVEYQTHELGYEGEYQCIRR